MSPFPPFSVVSARHRSYATEVWVERVTDDSLQKSRHLHEPPVRGRDGLRCRRGSPAHRRHSVGCPRSGSVPASAGFLTVFLACHRRRARTGRGPRVRRPGVRRRLRFARACETDVCRESLDTTADFAGFRARRDGHRVQATARANVTTRHERGRHHCPDRPAVRTARRRPRQGRRPDGRPHRRARRRGDRGPRGRPRRRRVRRGPSTSPTRPMGPRRPCVLPGAPEATGVQPVRGRGRRRAVRPPRRGPRSSSGRRVSDHWWHGDAGCAPE